MRGFAVLGILVANIPSFATRDMGGMLGGHAKLTGLDLWLDALATVFVTGKMRSILAILFGVGVWLQYQKRSRIEGNWPGGYIKRSLWLGLIGLCHAIFIWWGDILFFYAAMSILTAYLVSVDTRILKAVIGVGYGCSFLIGVGLAFLMAAYPMQGDDWTANLGQAFSTGSYLDQLKVRSVMFLFTLVFLGIMGGAMVPLFMLGLLFGRSGVLAKPSAHPRTRNAALVIGFGVGIPLNLLGLLKLRGTDAIDVLIEFSGGPVLAVGILMLGAMIAESGGLHRLTDALAKVGRVALTTYLFQSVLASVLFYSWGLGLIGRVSFTQQLGIVAGIWVFNLLFAHLWLRRYPMGPVEWLLRSLTEGRRLANAYPGA